MSPRIDPEFLNKPDTEVATIAAHYAAIVGFSSDLQTITTIHTAGFGNPNPCPRLPHTTR